MSIELKNVTFTYSQGTAYESHALKDINLVIPDGQFIGVIGHTGSGKSTLIQHFNALIQPTSGQVLYNGEDVWAENYDRRALRSEVGLVFQYPEHQLFENTVLADVCFGPKNQGLSKEECEKRALEALKLVGLKEKYYKSSPFELSGGQKRRVAIAGVLAMRPKVLVLDEPTAGLDPKGRDDILGQIAKLQKERGITYLFIAHDLSVMRYISDRIAVIHKGDIVELADAEELVTHAIHPYTRSLLSAIPMPSPRRERQKKLLVYDPAIHDYSAEAPQWRELRPRHWVLCSAAEAEAWCREL